MNDPFDLPPDVLGRVPLFAELSKVLSWTRGPVNWDLARQIAVSVAATDPPSESVGGAEHADVAEHVRVAELWLEEAALFPASTHLVTARAASPTDWADAAPITFAEIIDPVAARVTRALGEHAGDIPGVADAGTISQALGQMGPMFMGIQAGTVLGALARELLGTFELFLPTADENILLIVPTVDRMAREYDLDRRQVRQWAALGAAAHRMVLEGFPWVRTRFFALYHDYVASLDVDLDAGIQRLQSLDPSDPAMLKDILGEEGLFAPQASEATTDAAARIGTFVSLLEAHAALAVSAAGRGIGDVARIGETFARRAASSGTGARALATFTGLEGPTRRAQARAFGQAVLERGGWHALNRLWEEPEAFPTDAEIDAPETWLRRVEPA